MNFLFNLLMFISLFAIPVLFIWIIVNLIRRKPVKKLLLSFTTAIIATIAFAFLSTATMSKEQKDELAKEEAAQKSKEKQKDDKVTTEKPTTEKPTTEKPTTEKPTTEKPTTEKPTTEKPTTEKPTTEKADNNKVYGALTDKNAKSNGSLYINKKDHKLYMGSKKEIYQVEKQFDSSLGLNIDMDLSFLMEHAHDYMQEDATQIQKLSDNEFVFESPSINKKYIVVLSRPDGKTVTRVIVSQQD